MENWKPIEGYEGIYEVSDQGRVRNIKLGRLMTAQKVTHGYLAYNLSKQGRTRSLLAHRLVAIAFIPNPENKEQVNHKDLNKSRNSVDNLEWVTRQENLDHAEKYKPWNTRRNPWRNGSPENRQNYTANLWRSKVEDLRERKGLTREELSEMCCVRLETLAGLENGTKSFRGVSVNVACKLAWALGVSIEALFDYDVAEAIRREKAWHSKEKKKEE
jgi:DNA-binding XRE family transcriptional regulator